MSCTLPSSFKNKKEILLFGLCENVLLAQTVEISTFIIVAYLGNDYNRPKR